MLPQCKLCSAAHSAGGTLHQTSLSTKFAFADHLGLKKRKAEQVEQQEDEDEEQLEVDMIGEADVVPTVEPMPYTDRQSKQATESRTRPVHGMYVVLLGSSYLVYLDPLTLAGA